MKTYRVILASTALLSSTANAQSLLGNLLRQSLQQSQARNRQQAATATARQEKLSQIQMYIDRLPDKACELPENDLKTRAIAALERGDLQKTVDATVYHPATQPLTPYEILSAEVNADTRRRSAAARASYNGGQVPVGEEAAAPSSQYRVDISNFRATGRIAAGLTCAADVSAASLRYTVTYTFVLAADESDGWAGTADEPDLTEAFALVHPDRIKINFQDQNYQSKQLSLAEARIAAAASRAADLQRQRQADAATPRHSPAAYRGCQGLEAGVKSIIQDNSSGKVKVLEVATDQNSAGARADGTLSCAGIVSTNFGQVTGSYGTSRSPKGQLLIEWHPN